MHWCASDCNRELQWIATVNWEGGGADPPPPRTSPYDALKWTDDTERLYRGGAATVEFDTLETSTHCDTV